MKQDMWIKEGSPALDAVHAERLSRIPFRNSMDFSLPRVFPAGDGLLDEDPARQQFLRYQTMRIPAETASPGADHRLPQGSEFDAQDDGVPCGGITSGSAIASDGPVPGRCEGGRALGVQICLRRGQCCFEKAGAVVEMASVPKGRKSAIRPSTRRSQRRPGEPLAPSTSTGERPRSAIHGSETHTFVTDGLVQPGPFGQIPVPPLRAAAKHRHRGLLEGCEGRSGGSREPAGQFTA